ncbi:MAG TPA: hypothetical protein VGI10_09545 [Polyangiaceae bacterium]|jgi:hypothetical protein
MKRLSLSLLVLGLLTCNEAPPVKSARLSDGSWRLHCGASLTYCADKAEALCKGRGLTLLSGRSEHKLYGHADGASQVEAHSSDLVIKCVERKGGEPDALAEAPVLVPVAPSSERACTPGTTQRCVGVGACAGGQACLADGSAFGPCDCGAPPPAASVAPPPVSPAPAPAP